MVKNARSSKAKQSHKAKAIPPTTASTLEARPPSPGPANAIGGWFGSLFLLAVLFFMTFQPTLRMLRLWVNHDGFERHKLDFKVDGVQAVWGYAAWAGLFDGAGKLSLKDIPPLLNHNIEGGALVIDGIAFQSGIGTHAPGKIAFSLNGKFSRFSVLAGLDATSTGSQGAIYSILADGREIYRSPKLYLDAAPFPIDVPVSGVKELVLDADQTEFTNTGCNVDWVDLKFNP